MPPALCFVLECLPRCPDVTSCPFFGHLCSDPLACSYNHLFNFFFAARSRPKTPGERALSYHIFCGFPVTWPIAGPWKTSAARMNAGICGTHTQDPGWRLKELRAGQGHPLTPSSQRSGWRAGLTPTPCCAGTRWGPGQSTLAWRVHGA